MSNVNNTELDPKKQYDEICALFLNLEGKGLVVKDANLGNIRGDYYKGKDLDKLLSDHKEFVEKEYEKITGNKANDLPDNLYRLARKYGILIKAQKEKGDKLKYPKRLFPVEGIKCCDEDHGETKHTDPNKYDGNDFYIVNIQRGQKKLYFYLGLAIFGVLMYCLLPVWPLEVKLAIWWISYILLIIMVSLNVIRYSLYIVCYIFGLDFWLFPDLYDDKKGVIDSFKPLFKYEKREENIITIIIRICIFSTIAYGAYCIYDNPNLLNDLYDHLFEVAVDVFDWGQTHVINYHNGTAISLKNQKYKNILLDDDL